MVTQDTSLLHRSVRDNIRYGRPDATEEEIDRGGAAAPRPTTSSATSPTPRAARATTPMSASAASSSPAASASASRSPGVLLKDAPILVLDEATSALDSEVEAAIQEILYRLMEGKTVIAIAHRLSTIAAMDRLVVLDEGRIARDRARHDELLAPRRALCRPLAAPVGRLPAASIRPRAADCRGIGQCARRDGPVPCPQQCPLLHLPAP